MTYIDPELIVDETATAEALLAAFADRIGFALALEEGEQWEPAEGSPETSLSEGVGVLLATAMSLVQDRERDDFAAFGELILNTPRQAAEPSTGLARWTFGTSGAHQVPDGSELVLDAADGTPVAFATVGDFVFNGLFVDVPVAALDPGAIGNTLVGAARDFEALPDLVSVSVLAPGTAGGADLESRDEYLDRIARRARRVKLSPIVTGDYADTALDHPSVDSAVAVRLLNLTAPTDPPAAPGHVTVFVRGNGGGNLSAPDKEAVRLSMMGEDRPLSVTVHVGDPTRTDITVATSIRLVTGADEAATIAAVRAAIATAYDDAVYGVDEQAPGRWRAPRNAAERTINEYDVSTIVAGVVGVAKVEAATINGLASKTLLGYAPLPNLTAPATVTVLT